MKLEPQGAFVLIEKDPEAEFVSDGGITVRAGVIYNRLVHATVKAFGPKCGTYGLSPGDRVLVKPDCGSKIVDGNTTYHMVREVDLQAKLT